MKFIFSGLHFCCKRFVCISEIWW